jgi:hypothetical protein
VICVGDVKGSTFGTPGTPTVLPLICPKSVGSPTMNKDSSLSQHGELTASRTGGTDQLNAHSKLRIQILNLANSAEKVHYKLVVSISILDYAANHKHVK